MSGKESRRNQIDKKLDSDYSQGGQSTNKSFGNSCGTSLSPSRTGVIKKLLDPLLSSSLRRGTRATTNPKDLILGLPYTVRRKLKEKTMRFQIQSDIVASKGEPLGEGREFIVGRTVKTLETVGSKSLGNVGKKIGTKSLRIQPYHQGVQNQKWQRKADGRKTP